MTTHVKTPSPAELQALINTSKLPLLIDFSAQWCGPCQGMAPHLEAFAAEKKAEIVTVKIDIDAHPEIAQRFYVRSVPTLILLQDGMALGMHSGALRKSQIEKFVQVNSA